MAIFVLIENGKKHLLTKNKTIMSWIENNMDEISASLNINSVNIKRVNWIQIKWNEDRIVQFFVVLLFDCMFI